MTTNSPGPQSATMQGIPEVDFKATTSHLSEMVLGVVVACIVVFGCLAGFGKWYLDKSSENSIKAAEAQKAKIKLHQLQFMMFLSAIAENKDSKFTDQEKATYADILQDVTYEDVKKLLDQIQSNKDKQDLNFLIDSKQVENLNKDTDLRWNNGSVVQIKFVKRKNASLDFQKIDLFSTPPNPCSSKVIPLGSSSNTTVEICDSHLHEKLEITVIQTSE